MTNTCIIIFLYISGHKMFCLEKLFSFTFSFVTITKSILFCSALLRGVMLLLNSSIRSKTCQCNIHLKLLFINFLKAHRQTNILFDGSIKHICWNRNLHNTSRHQYQLSIILYDFSYFFCETENYSNWKQDILELTNLSQLRRYI